MFPLADIVRWRTVAPWADWREPASAISRGE